MPSSNRSSSPGRSRRRSRSPRLSHSTHSDRRRSSKTYATSLPFDAPLISKHDLSDFRPMFELYLDIQKGLILHELSENEVRGRWKSFVGKWNRGDLAKGWYDPQTLEKARSSSLPKPSYRSFDPDAAPKGGNDDSEDDEYGPTLPSSDLARAFSKDSAYKQGPAQPFVQDLQVKREMEAADAAEARSIAIDALRNERRADRRVQKERLDEIAPRAEAGTRERQLEKKREKADSNRSFAASAHDNVDVEVKDSDLMGGADGIDELKKMKQVEQRKRSDREKRREENIAARRAEREQRVQAMKEREAKTMSLLKEVAKARFGG